jgi:hypothetical protein
MIEAQQFWTPQNEWQAKLKSLEMAATDLNTNFETDAEGDFYVEAHTQALTDFMLLPVDEPKAILVKMALLKEHEVFWWQEGDFNKIWTALIDDVKRLCGPLPAA